MPLGNWIGATKCIRNPFLCPYSIGMSTWAQTSFYLKEVQYTYTISLCTLSSILWNSCVWFMCTIQRHIKIFMCFQILYEFTICGSSILCFFCSYVSKFLQSKEALTRTIILIWFNQHPSGMFTLYTNHLIHKSKSQTRCQSNWMLYFHS
jgi:hypothetical protein